jgi:hypothetical protein
MKDALRIGFRAFIRTAAQSLAGGLAALGVASVADFANVPQLAIVLLWGAALSALAAGLMNFSESIPKDDVCIPVEPYTPE